MQLSRSCDVAIEEKEQQSPLRRAQSESCLVHQSNNAADALLEARAAEYLVERMRQMGSLPEASQALLTELFAIVCGEDEVCGEDSTILERNPGHEKDAEQRELDCERVRAILASGAAGVGPNVYWTWGETLIFKALEYDYGHPPQMVTAILEARADPNLPNALGGERPLQSPWLEDRDDDGYVDGHRALVNAQKRALLAQYGADSTLNTARTRDSSVHGSGVQPLQPLRRLGPSLTEVDDESRPSRRPRRAWW